MSEDTLYLVHLNYSSCVVGGGSMNLSLAVDPIRHTISGGGKGSMLEGTEHPTTFTASGNGHMHATGLGDISNVGALSGKAVVSFPPPAIGSYEAPFTASFAVDGSWNGTGKFTVGNQTYECQVERAN